MGRLKSLPSRLSSPPARVKQLAPPDRQQTRALHTGSAEWRRIRQQVLERDGYRCQACGRLVVGRDAHIDHIDGNSHNNALTNLQTLCQWGHSRKTQAEKAGSTWDRRCTGPS